jgi:hypothetical protein
MQIAKNLQQSTLPNNKTKKLGSKNPKPKASTKPSNQLLQQQQRQQQQQQQQQQLLTNKSGNSFNAESFNSSIASSDDISVLPNGSSAYSDVALPNNFSNHSYESQSSNWVCCL